MLLYVAAGLGTYVEALVRKHDTEFNVSCYNSFTYFIFILLVVCEWASNTEKRLFCDNNILVVFNILQVIVTQTSGLQHPTESIHTLHVGKMRIKLCKGKTTIAKEYYSSSMQVHRIVSGF